MSTVQERLKLKRAQIDTWSIREQLCLASSVLRSGDQNWMSVSRSLKAFGDPGRPADWFSQKSCAVQYSNLLENVETPKRKKRTDKGDTSVETPSESIVRRLTQERIEELKRLLNEDRQKYAKLKEEVVQIKAGFADDKLKEMCQEIEEEKRQKERRAEAHERWLKEREEKKVELERAWKPPVALASPHRRKQHPKIPRRNSSQSEPSSEADSALDSPLSEPLNVDVIGEESVQDAAVEPEPSQTPTSPLLTSLLKSPSPAPTSQGSSILHSAITSHRGASPTITSLLSSAPGVPGGANMVSVAPPTTVSSSLKNLVSSAISSEQPHHQPPPHNPSPAAGAPTLSMLLELPPSLPGKPLPELPSAVKTTTLPPSTVTAIASTATTTTVAATSKVMAVRVAMPTTIAPTISSKITTSIPVSGGAGGGGSDSDIQASSEEIKIVDSTSKDDDIEILQVDSTQSTSESQTVPIETKEELIEEVLIEEVVVNDDSVIESELLTTQISDVVVSAEQEDVKEKTDKVAEEMKVDEHFIEVSQSTEISQKEESKTEMVAEVDSTSSNSERTGNVESTNNTGEKDSKEESIEAIIDSGSQDMVSEIVTEEAAAVEMVPATEAELTSGTVAEVIEITDDQDTSIQTEVVDECEPCMQELEDMEVIILDKVQELDDVQIVEDIKELECEVVEVVMGTQEKADEEIKGSGELEQNSLKPEEETSEETCTLVTDTAIECKNTEDEENIDNSKSVISTTEQAEDNLDTTSEKVEHSNEVPAEEELADEEEKPENEEEKPENEEEKPENEEEKLEIMRTEDVLEIEDDCESNKVVAEKSLVEENVEEQQKEMDNNGEEKEESSEEEPQNIIVSSSESPKMADHTVLEDKETDIKEGQDVNIDGNFEKEYSENEVKDDTAVKVDNVMEDSSLKVSNPIENPKEKDTLEEEISPDNEKDDVPENTVKKDIAMTEELKKNNVEEAQVDEKVVIEELSTNDDVSEETSSKKDNVLEEMMKNDDIEEEKKDLQCKEQKVSPPEEEQNQLEEPVKDEVPKVELKAANKEVSKRDLQKVSDNSRKLSKETLKRDAEKMNIKEKDVSKREVNKKETQSPPKEIVKDSQGKETKKDSLSKDKKEVQIVLTKDAVKKDAHVEEDANKSVSCKENSKKDSSSKKELITSKKDYSISKKEHPSKRDLAVKEKDIVKETPTKRELLRRDSKDDVSKKETLKRGVLKDDQRDSPREDLRKRPHIKEITKSSRRFDIDSKSNDIAKPEPVGKIEKVRKEIDTSKEEIRESKREKIARPTQQKGEEEKIKDELPLKETKTLGNNSKMKSYGEESIKHASTTEKKEGKEQHKTTGKQELAVKPEPVEHSDEKPERRLHLRSETPSTEDDKTNDAELPKVVGRKRLANINVLDSIPNSPASTTDEEREYKSWKKSIMLLYGRLATHKYASLFLRPITDDQAPGYSSVVHRPIDLLTIKKNIETGVIRTTAEFQRDVMLMFLNSIMYNKSSHLVHKMAKQMQQEGMQHIQDFITTQMLVQVVGDGVPIRRETRTTEANKQRDILGNPSQEDGEGTLSQVLHKRKRNTASDSSERGFKKKKMDD